VFGLPAATPLAQSTITDQSLVRTQSYARRLRVVERDATR